MKSIGQIDYEAYWGDDSSYGAVVFEKVDEEGRERCQRGAKAVLAHASTIIRERAETDTNTWAARDEWRRVALLLENME